MSNATLIQKLLKRLFQVLATLATSSARRLFIILVSFFQRFVAKARVPISHDTDSKFSTVESCCTVLTGTSSARCFQSTLPLIPLHTTPSSAASPVASTPPGTMPASGTPQHANLPQTSSPPAAGSAVFPNGLPANFHFVPSAVDHKSRYDNRPSVYVDAAHNGE
jgi:hypothetical protein